MKTHIPEQREICAKVLQNLDIFIFTHLWQNDHLNNISPVLASLFSVESSKINTCERKQ